MIRRSTATLILQLMEKNALLTREPVEYDARLKKLELTPKAIAIYERIREKSIEVEERLCRGLSEEEVAFFFSIMDEIRRNLEAVVK